jgi:hypothetical protein
MFHLGLTREFLSTKQKQSLTESLGQSKRERLQRPALNTQTQFKGGD